MAGTRLVVDITGSINSLDQLELLIEGAAKLAVKEGAEDLKKEIESTITDQKGSWPPLSQATLMAKAPETRALIDSGDMVSAIDIKSGQDDYIKTIGVHDDKSENHRAAKNEFGDPADNVPERSFVRSTAERVEKQTLKNMERIIDKVI